MADKSASTVNALQDEWHGLFSRVGLELRTLAGSVNNLQLFMTPLLEEVVDRDPHAILRLQDLDILEQSLHGLSDLMSCLDRSFTLTDAEAVAHGVKTLTLAELAQRLAPPLSALVEPATDSSTLELFD